MKTLLGALLVALPFTVWLAVIYFFASTFTAALGGGWLALAGGIVLAWICAEICATVVIGGINLLIHVLALGVIEGMSGDKR